MTSNPHNSRSRAEIRWYGDGNGKSKLEISINHGYEWRTIAQAAEQTGEKMPKYMKRVALEDAERRPA